MHRLKDGIRLASRITSIPVTSSWFFRILPNIGFFLIIFVQQIRNIFVNNYSLQNARYTLYRGADKSLARPTSRCILFDGENISFEASLVLYIYIYIYIYIYGTNIPPIMIINRIYQNQNLLSV